MGERVLDAELSRVTGEAFAAADSLPADDEVRRVLDTEPLTLLGEGYHVMALVEPARRFVVKYAKSRKPVPPLGAPEEHASSEAWRHDHGVHPDGTLHAAIWQHIRAFESYGPLAVPCRVYLAESAAARLRDDQRRMLERFRLIGIVRRLSEPRRLRVCYPDHVAKEKRAADGVVASIVIVQPLVTPLASAIERLLRDGDDAAVRELEAQYDEFTQQLWRSGISHLDFSMLNIGIVGSGETQRLQLFDPHIGDIDVGEGSHEVRDPLTESPSGERSVDNVLRSSRDGSRWALWRIQEKLTAAEDVPPERAEGAAQVVRQFHAASEGIEQGEGTFGLQRFERTWQQHPTHRINTVMHAQLWALLTHPLGQAVRSVIEGGTPDATYERAVPVLGMHDDQPLPQFRAGLRVYDGKPLIAIANLQDGPAPAKHWGRLRLPAELDIQADEAIHYHLRDLFTGETYVHPGERLSHHGFVIGLPPHALHVLQVEDITVGSLPLERVLASERDIADFLRDCTKRVGVVGDVHGELQALQEVLLALGFVDAAGRWAARDGTLVLTGDIGHGRHLQEVFDFIHRLARQAHRGGGRIVWTLGNHDLYVDREGGQGGEQSLGYRLWPRLREAALHPERHPGLVVQAVYFEYGKLFVHGGLLPNIVDVARREGGARDTAEIAAFVNGVLRRTLVERERISARDLPHDIFHVGTSHARERRYPGEVGYEPAGVFTPDLREVDHYRYHSTLVPQIVGHTASRRGEIRYSPGSWLRRDYIAIDVGRQHGRGNGGLLLTDFGWVAVTPGGPALLVEVSPLFARLAEEAAAARLPAAPGPGVIKAYFQAARPERTAVPDNPAVLREELSPPQVAALERFRTAASEGRSVLITDLDEMLTAFSSDSGEGPVSLLAEFVRAGGVLLYSTCWPFEWLYARLLRSLVVELGPRSPLLTRVLPITGDGASIYVFDDGAYRLVSDVPGRNPADALKALATLPEQQRPAGVPAIDPRETTYLAASFAPQGIDRELTDVVGTVIDVGDVLFDSGRKPLVSLHRGYERSAAAIAEAAVALRSSGKAPLPESEYQAVGDTVRWTFRRPEFPAGRRVRVCVRGSGFVHAGVVGSKGKWDPVYEVPLIPLRDGTYEALLPAGVNAFTFFWTEPPWVGELPGHWEREPRGPRVFRARMLL